MSIAENVAQLHAEIASACEISGRSVDEVNVIAVTKSQGPEVLPELAAAGISCFGENRLDHLKLMQEHDHAEWSFHGIGRLQSRQLPEWVERCSCLHSLHSPSHLPRLDRACAGLQLDDFPIFIQVNTSGEAAKAGCVPGELAAFLDATSQCKHIAVQGLMCMAPLRDDDHSNDQAISDCFGLLKQLADQHGLKRLSMGMSGDFDLAIRAGATDIRIGTRLFV